MANNAPHQIVSIPPRGSQNGGIEIIDPAVEEPRAGHSGTPVNYAAKTRSGVTLFAVIVAAALIVAFALVERSHKKARASLSEAVLHSSEQPVSVDVVRVARGKPERILTLPGDARSFIETTIYARVSGYLESWKHDIGDQVKKGDVLAIIETPELDDQIHEAKAKVAQLKSEVNVATAQANFAQVSVERWQRAAKDGEGAVSLQELDEKKAELESDRAKLEAAKSAVNLGNAALDRLNTLYKFKQVVAPIDGVITHRDVDYGDLVTAGSTSNTTPLFTMSQSNQIRVFVDVPQPAVGDIRVGMHAKATARELPGQTFIGVVDRTRSSLDPRSRTLGVEVLVPNPGLKLLPGMYVQVSFETSRKDPPLRVPAAALAFGPTGAQVAVVSEGDRVMFHPVTIARDMGDSVEIGTGLRDGDLVALNVGNQVVDGERVEAHVVESAPTAPALKNAGAPATQPAVTAQLAG